jgi:alkanesulfonate monooxygenase SsuD/methylene tetrahydromethanopterin reductase-like flavin-dependent oxidoreductase (luciferase family)
VRVGVLLPTFEATAEPALGAAAAAAAAGLDGVFAYDHLWPMGHPARPALAPFPVLAAVAAAYRGLHVGPLIARVGLVGTRHLVEEFVTLEALAPGRVVAALGTGDHLSAAEDDAYGLARRDADERRGLVRDTARELIGRMPVWIGAGAAPTNDLAAELGATLNLWDVAAGDVAAAAARGPVSWAGPLRGDVGAQLDQLAVAGASWAVASSSVSLEGLANWRREHPLTTFP